jgi:hypothetical protein
MIKEINGRWTCSDCDYEWSATAGDNEIPELCDNCYLDRYWNSFYESKFKLPNHTPWKLKEKTDD